MDVAIIDYKMSNLHSVNAACKYVGLDSVISSDPKEIIDAKIAILPGVGSFDRAMLNLKKLKLENCIYDFINSGRTFVGICLGLQLLFTRSEEFGDHLGLDILEGEIKKFKINKDRKFPVPQISWNKINMKNIEWDKTHLFENNDGDFMYFVHSYYAVPKDQSIILTETSYGDQNYCSSILKENIFAMQFHPEKSSVNGLKIYESLYKSINNL